MLSSFLSQLDITRAVLFFTVLNVGVVVASAGFFYLIRALFSQHLLFVHPKPLAIVDFVLAITSVLTNVVISVFGWVLWKRGWLPLATGSFFTDLFTFFAMLLFMDLGMYVTHRIAHHWLLYSWLHRQHHDHVETNALSLFVLNPIEVLGFGGLMLLAIFVVRPTESALVWYLTMNLLYGSLGHTGAALMSEKRAGRGIAESLDPSLFHSRHHTHPTSNFGFYSPVWDWLFGTWGRFPTEDQVADGHSGRA